MIILDQSQSDHDSVVSQGTFQKPDFAFRIPLPTPSSKLPEHFHLRIQHIYRVIMKRLHTPFVHCLSDEVVVVVIGVLSRTK